MYSASAKCSHVQQLMETCHLTFESSHSAVKVAELRKNGYYVALNMGTLFLPRSP